MNAVLARLWTRFFLSRTSRDLQISPRLIYSGHVLAPMRTRQAVVRLLRRRQLGSPVRRAVQPDGRHRGDPRPLQGRRASRGGRDGTGGAICRGCNRGVGGFWPCHSRSLGPG